MSEQICEQEAIMESSKDIQAAVKARYRQAAAGGGCCNSSSEVVEFQQIRGGDAVKNRGQASGVRMT